MRARDNAFAVQRCAALPFIAQGTTIPELAAQLSSMGWSAAIVGQHGTGKTTLLQELLQTLQRQGILIRMVRLHTDESKENFRKLASALLGPKREVLLVIDGAEQINWFFWQLLKIISNFYKGLLITSHHAGLLPTLYHCRTDLSLLRTLASQLGVSPAQDLNEIFSRNAGNIREVFFELYDSEQCRGYGSSK